MCGRYGRISTDKQLIERFDLEKWNFELHDSYNVSPTHEEPVVERHSPNSLHLYKWGIFPGFMKGGILINAQASKLADSKVWKKAFIERRCVIPADYFIEWKNEGKNKQPFLIRLKSKEIMAFAGLVVTAVDKDGKEHTGYVIITTEPNSLMEKIHNRMTCILTKEEEEEWLNPDNVEPEKLMKLLHPYPADAMEAYPISSLVNSPKNNFKDLITPIDTVGSETLFSQQ